MLTMKTILGVVFVTVMCVWVVDGRRPNIILILTDDQDIVLDGFTPMTKTQQLIGDEGVTFSNAFCTTPVCCPSRSSILTGLYQHNHGVVNNSVSGECSGPNWQQNLEPKTFAKQLHDAGYKTFYAGKYLNEYGFAATGGTEHIPVGWDWWIGLVGNSVYYDYSLSVNGTKIHHGADPEKDYLTDVVKNYSVEFLKQSYIVNNEDGFLMAINPPSAHAPFTPSPKYQDYYKGKMAPRTPNYNVRDNNKHWLMRLAEEPLTQPDMDTIDGVYRGRLETLKSVDDIVEAVVDQLKIANVLDNTYIIFTSDHGFHLGQFSQPWDKRQLYEFDIRIPMLVRGPGVAKKQVVNHPVLTIDLAPTIIDMAGGVSSSPMDGESFLPLITDIKQDYNRSFLIEYSGEGSGTQSECWNDTNLMWCMPDVSCRCQDSRNNTYSCVRRLSNVENDIYCEFEDDEHFIESYNLNVDPHQLNNLRKSYMGLSDILNCYKLQSDFDKKSFVDCVSLNKIY